MVGKSPRGEKGLMAVNDAQSDDREQNDEGDETEDDEESDGSVKECDDNQHEFEPLIVVPPCLEVNNDCNSCGRIMNLGEPILGCIHCYFEKCSECISKAD